MAKYDDLLAEVETAFSIAIDDKALREVASGSRRTPKCIEDFIYRLDCKKDFAVVEDEIQRFNTTQYSVYYFYYDEDGFLIKRLIAKFRYIVGIYGGVQIGLYDQADVEIICSGKAIM